MSFPEKDMAMIIYLNMDILIDLINENGII